jgi:hypothetical protein
MCRIWSAEQLLKHKWALWTELVSYSKKRCYDSSSSSSARAHERTHAHTHTHCMRQLVILVQHNTIMHCNALHNHNMNHFTSWTPHGQQYKATPFWHLITVPWTCTGLTPAFTLMWCHSACTPNPQALQNGPVIQHAWKQQAHTTRNEHKSGAFCNVMQCTLVKTSETLKEPAPSIIRIVCYTEGEGSRFF